MKRFLTHFLILFFPLFAFAQEEKFTKSINSFLLEEKIVPSEKPLVEKSFDLHLTEGVIYPLSFQTEIQCFFSLPGSVSNQQESIHFEYGAKLIQKGEGKLFFELYLLDLSIPHLVWGEYADSVMQKKFLAFWGEHSNDLLYAFEEPHFNLVLSSYGELFELSGKERFKNHAFSILQKRMDWGKDSDFVEAFFEFLFQTVESQWQSLYFFHPKKNIVQGGYWKESVPGAMGSSLEYRFCFDRSDEKNDFITVSGKVLIPSLKESFGVEGLGWIRGYYILDSATGWILGGNLQAGLNQQEIISIDGIRSFLKVRLVEYRRH